MTRDTYEHTAQGVTIATQSGLVRGSKRSPYIKWLMGWIDGGGWSGDTTLRDAWAETSGDKPDGCSWYAYGLITARAQRKGRELAYREMG